MKYIRSFVDWWKRTFNKQGRIGKIIFSCLSLFVLCCLCSIPVGLFAPSSSTQSAPTAPTLLPVLVSDTPTIASTTPTVQTDTPTPQEITPTETPTALPTETQPVLPTATVGESNNDNTLVIIAVDKVAEYVDIQNVGSQPVDLNGWVLVSETGNQSCGLSGVIQPDEVLRIWAMNGSPGFSCGYSTNIWNNSKSDPAVLYNPQGQEVSRY